MITLPHLSELRPAANEPPIPSPATATANSISISNSPSLSSSSLDHVLALPQELSHAEKTTHCHHNVLIEGAAPPLCSLARSHSRIALRRRRSSDPSPSGDGRTDGPTDGRIGKGTGRSRIERARPGNTSRGEDRPRTPTKPKRDLEFWSHGRDSASFGALLLLHRDKQWVETRADLRRVQLQNQRAQSQVRAVRSSHVAWSVDDLPTCRERIKGPTE